MLFRDCGMAAMIAQFPNYGQIVDAYTRTASAQVNALEMSRYRYHHGRVGYALTRSWQLPEPFCLSILHHHDLDQPESGIALLDGANYRLIAFGLLADQVFALRHGKGLRPDWLAQERHVLATLQVLPEEIIAYLHADDAEAAVPEDALA
jgi:HD-like signal output (HDOD) protein